jgi:hypothetical protein
MRPQIFLPKGEQPKLPPVLTKQQVQPKSAQPKTVQPKTVDDFMDKVVDVKDVAGKVVFTGTPRQWQKWASQREREARLAVGLPAMPKEPVSQSRSYR